MHPGSGGFCGEVRIVGTGWMGRPNFGILPTRDTSSTGWEELLRIVDRDGAKRVRWRGRVIAKDTGGVGASPDVAGGELTSASWFWQVDGCLAKLVSKS